MTRVLFAGGEVFDGTGAGAGRADVVVEDGRIVQIGIGLDGDLRVDTSGMTVLPGFIDAHVHVTVSSLDRLALLNSPFSLQFFEAARNLGVTLAAGVTTARDAGGADLGIAQALNLGLISGPRLQLSIVLLSQTGGHGDPWHASGCVMPLIMPHPGRPGGVVDGPAQARRKVREVIRAGADVIKIATSGGVVSPRDDPRHAHFRDDELQAILAEADAADRPVMAHAQSATGILNAVRAGVRSVEHGHFLDERGIEEMVKRGTWLVPTITAGISLLEAAGTGMGVDPSVVAKARLIVEAQRETAPHAIEAGVRIAMGTDAGVAPHGRNLREVELLVEYGMTPEQALHAATGSAAELLRVGDDRGTLEPGKRADIVLIDGTTSELTGLSSRVRAVYQDGCAIVRRHPDDTLTASGPGAELRAG